MASRLSLHEDLLKITNKVYYQPPESLKLSYPCIIYALSKKAIRYADDNLYNCENAYDVTVIDKNPDTVITDNILKAFPKCAFNRRFVSDNLYHDSLVLYY